MPIEIVFAFKPGDQVLTPFEDMGIVQTCAVTGRGINLQYYVQRKNDSEWFDEADLRFFDPRPDPIPKTIGKA